MIELTEQRARALENPEATPPRIVNSRTKETFVLLRVDEYERLTEEAYDDSPWTGKSFKPWHGSGSSTRTGMSTTICRRNHEAG